LARYLTIVFSNPSKERDHELLDSYFYETYPAKARSAFSLDLGGDVMRATVFAYAFAAAVLLPPSSFAQEVKSAEEIVQFFSKAVDLGAQRGICVGTEQECAAKREK